jgi:hypothetical protein
VQASRLQTPAGGTPAPQESPLVLNQNRLGLHFPDRDSGFGGQDAKHW